MVALQRRLSLHFGRAVPLQDMFEDPTIRGIARSLADGRVRTHARVASAAPADDGRPRLFMMPGILSLPFHLRDMATAVASELVLVSAQLPGLLGDERPIATVEEQAAFVLGEIRKAQPHGPYLIGGHSYGGCVAIEVARQLRDAGEAVPLLLLGDTVRTRTDLSAFQTTPVAQAAMARALYALYGDRLPVTHDALEEIEPAQRLRQTGDAITDAGLLGRFALPLDRMIDVFKANWRALGAYRPQPIPGDLTLIRTEDGFPPEFLDHEPSDSLDDPGLGWTELVQGRIDIHTIPGDHLSILQESTLPGWRTSSCGW